MRMEKTFDERYKKYGICFFFLFSVYFIFAYLSFCLSSCPAVFFLFVFFSLFQSDHMHYVCVYIKLYSIVRVALYWWNQEVAELFVFFIPVWSYLNICSIYIYKKYICICMCIIWFFELIFLALYLCHNRFNFVDLWSVPIYKWICLL